MKLDKFMLYLGVGLACFVGGLAYVSATAPLKPIAVFEESEPSLYGPPAGDRRGCDASGGSAVPFPASGALTLSASEAKDAQGALPMDQQGEGWAKLSVSNVDDRPHAVLLLGEDGKPKAKLFARAGESAAIKVKEGSYDLLFQTGSDWRGDGFGACSKSGKVKGIVVAAAGKESRVELHGLSRFVVANRVEPAAAAAMDAADKARAEARAGERPVALARPDRGGRDERPASNMD